MWECRQVVMRKVLRDNVVQWKCRKVGMWKVLRGNVENRECVRFYLIGW